LETALFQPKDGTAAEWERVYKLIEPLSIGQTITYGELTDCLGRDFLSQRGPFIKANQVLLKEHQRGLVNVRGTGYRVITAADHIVPAKASHKRAHRALRRSRHWIENTDRSQLSPADRQRFDEMEGRLRQQEDMTRRIDQRVSRVEKAVQQTRQEHQSTQEEMTAKMARMQAAMERAGLLTDLPEEVAS
jgi:alkylated DNA nucleotide flippase Atl1